MKSPGSSLFLRRLLLAVAAAKAALSLGVALAAMAAGTAPPGPRLAMLMLLCAAFGIVGTGLALYQQRDRRAEHYAGFLLLCASSFGDGLLHYAGTSLTAYADVLGWVGRIRVEAFLPFFLWRFVGEFPHVATDTPERFARWFTRICLVAGLLLATSSFLAESGNVAFSALSRPAATSLYWPLLFGLILPAMPFALLRTRRAEPAERRRVSLLVAGLVAGFAPVVLEVILEAIAPPFRAVMDQPRARNMVGPVIYLGLASIPFTTAYAVLVHRALGFRLVLRLALQYALARGTVVAATLVPFLALLLYLWNQRERTLSGMLTGAPALFLAGSTVAGILGVASRRRLLDGIDRRFFREQYDSRRILTGLVARARGIQDPKAFAELWAAEIDRALHVEAIAVLVLEPSGARYSPVAGACRPLSARSMLVEFLGADTAPMDADIEGPQARLRRLPEEERAWLAEGPFRLLTPLGASDGKTIGFIALGAKRSEAPFSDEDRALLHGIAASGSLALESLLARTSDEFRRISGQTTTDGDDATECTSCRVVCDAREDRCPRCGSPTSQAPIPRVVRGKYVVERRIGEGGMGAVYLARETELDRPVALKVLPRRGAASALALRREAQVMAAISHPNLATIHTIETWRGSPVLVIEFLEGGTLADRIALGPLSVSASLEVVSAIAAALERTHAHGFLHRDVKPSNIGFTAEGVPKLLDFGLARILAAERTRSVVPEAAPGADMNERPTVSLGTTTHRIVGTPLYMSPEAYSSARPHAAFDLWGLAVVLYESIAGRNPFSASTLDEVRGRIVSGDVSDVRAHAPDCPDAVADFTHRALSRDPRLRPATARAFREGVTALARGL